MKTLIIAVVVALTLSACGGGGNSPNYTNCSEMIELAESKLGPVEHIRDSSTFEFDILDYWWCAQGIAIEFKWHPESERKPNCEATIYEFRPYSISCH
ncbi:MAG: hypothetical protein GY941_19715 [Planctomycetes bacterium]|nr:hypothetical protein [Planctomycetota bacterium]